MAGLAGIERRGTIDTARQCIGGHYGGAMTAWIVGHDTRSAGARRRGRRLGGSVQSFGNREPRLLTRLIFTGLADQVRSVCRSWAFYHALRENHLPVRLVGIPTAHHTPRDPVRHESYEQRILDWFAEHLR